MHLLYSELAIGLVRVAVVRATVAQLQVLRQTLLLLHPSAHVR